MCWRASTVRIVLQRIYDDFVCALCVIVCFYRKNVIARSNLFTLAAVDYVSFPYVVQL